MRRVNYFILIGLTGGGESGITRLMNKGERFVAGAAVTVVAVAFISTFGIKISKGEENPQQPRFRAPRAIGGSESGSGTLTPEGTGFSADVSTETPVFPTATSSPKPAETTPKPTPAPIPKLTPTLAPTEVLFPTPKPIPTVLEEWEKQEDEGEFVGSSVKNFSFDRGSLRRLKELEGWTESRDRKMLFDSSVFEFSKDFKNNSSALSAQLQGKWIKDWDINKESIDNYVDRMLFNLQLRSYSFKMQPSEIQVPSGVKVLLNLERSSKDAGGVDTLRYTAIIPVKGSKFAVVSLFFSNPKTPEEKNLVKPSIATFQAVIATVMATS